VILVVGLSPAWQRTLEYERFVVGKVNRAKRVSETGSGKGVNVTRVAQQLGGKARLLTVAGGHRGELLEKSLREQGIDVHIVHVSAETRICQTLLAQGFPTTELVEEAGALTKKEVRAILSCFEMEVRKAGLVVLSGTVPRRCGDDFYARLVREANRRGIPVLVDTQRGQLMNAVRQKPLLVKINRDELAAATGARCDRARGLRVAGRRLAKLGAQWIVVTHGSDEVHVFAGHDAKGWAFKPPRVDARNPIGSGDAMLAGIACGLGQGRTMLEAVRWGIACGAANAMTAMPGFVRRADAGRLLKRV
jgi:tagatose 6-phosphate kinase